MTPREFWLIYDAKKRQADATERELSGKLDPPDEDEIATFEAGLPEKLRSEG